MRSRAGFGPSVFIFNRLGTRDYLTTKSQWSADDLRVEAKNHSRLEPLVSEKKAFSFSKRAADYFPQVVSAITSCSPKVRFGGCLSCRLAACLRVFCSAPQASSGPVSNWHLFRPDGPTLEPARSRGDRYGGPVRSNCPQRHFLLYTLAIAYNLRIPSHRVFRA